ncbi:response regulator transcription factor [Haloarchaeobius sp. HRN-SO-5]|uniref:response regulator transcription factor n=1 Tax=Haloarchaeobius sp. HRN-SO-5 TaxID=3446118 RepID=UPI003EBE5160
MPADESEGDREGDRPTVLVVDGEEKLADMYTLWLRANYDVRTVYDGEEALGELDGVDVVLLERHLPDQSGDQVLEAVQRRTADVSVVVVTGVEPSFTILELPFDDYLCKPVRHGDLVDAIEHQLLARDHGDVFRRYTRLTASQQLLEMGHSPDVLDGHGEFRDLQREAEELEARLRHTDDGFEEAAATFRSIDRGPGRSRSRN